jgi:hypothetical protein
MDALKKSKWDSKNDEAHRLVGLSISKDLKFHLQEIDIHNSVWLKLEKFGKHNQI